MAHCWLKLYLEAAYENIEFSTVPFSIGVGGKEYLDDDSLNIGELMSAMQECKTASRTAVRRWEHGVNNFKKTVIS